MKHFNIILIIILGIIISACNAPESAIQTAIAQTGTAMPTATDTPIPTPTFTFTPEPTNTPTNTPEPPSIEQRIIGKWSGAMTNKNGDKIPAFWTFLDGGIMIVDINIMGYSYGAEWHVEGYRLYFTSELDPSNPTYRDVEFVTDDVMILTKEEAGIKETWTRVDE